MTVTIDDLKKACTRGILFLDCGDSYSNHFECVEYPRLKIVNTGPRGRRGKGKHERKYFVDDMECPDLDAVLTMLNAREVA
jgi:hypothetical protein